MPTQPEKVAPVAQPMPTQPEQVAPVQDGPESQVLHIHLLYGSGTANGGRRYRIIHGQRVYDENGGYDANGRYYYYVTGHRVSD